MNTSIIKSLFELNQLTKNLHFTIPHCVLLYGDLGTGKTAFVQSWMTQHNMNVIVSSPTFPIINQYTDNICHIDMYRIKHINEMRDLEIPCCRSLNFIEWPKFIEEINIPTTTIRIQVLKNQERSITIES